MMLGFRFLVLCCFLSVVVSCTNKDTNAEVKHDIGESFEIKPEVIFAIADKEALTYSIESQGIAEADKELTIQPRISGYVKEWAIFDGKIVKQDDLLFSLADDEWHLAVRDAEDKFIKAQSEYLIEKKQRDARNGASERNENEIDDMLKSQTGYTAALVNLERAKLNHSYTEIHAPFSGIIQTKTQYQPGQFINASIILGKLINQEKMRIRLDVLESDINKIKRGMIVRLTHQNSNQFTGKVESVSPSVDPNTKTAQVVVLFDNSDQNIKAGMTLQGTIILQNLTGKCRVPRNAVLDRDNRQLVFKLKGDEVEWLYVTPSALSSEWAILNEPSLGAGDTIAIDQHFAISHLQKVTVKVK